MSRKNSICFSIIGILLLISLLVTFMYDDKKETRQVNETQMDEFKKTKESNYEIQPYKYCVIEEDSYLVVYMSNMKDVFLKTSIPANTLSAHLQEELKSGIRFETEADLYSFLESYSS